MQKITRLLTSDELTAMQVEKDESLIPHNQSYCYESCTQSKENPLAFPITNLCPYWRVASDKHQQLSGYCLYLEKGDWQEDGTMALFDQLKQCGINDGFVYEHHPKGTLGALLEEHYDMEHAVNSRTLSNKHFSFDFGSIHCELQEAQLHKQFGRAKRIYRRLLKLKSH